MSKTKIFTFIGISATMFVGGLAFLITQNDTLFKPVGYILVSMGFIISCSSLLYAKFAEISGAGIQRAKEIGDLLDDKIGSLDKSIRGYTESLQETCDKLGLQNDGRFVPKGFIGLQQQANKLEQDQNLDGEYVRKAVLSHLPSHMRINDLTDKRGNQLYHNWEPPDLVPMYVEITNKRKEALKTFVNNNGIVREIYDANKIENYVREQFTFHDNIKDPPEEIEERLRSLLYYIEQPNFYLGLIKNTYTGPRYMLKDNVGLLIDLRSTEIDAHFTNSIDGVYTESLDLLNEFDRKFGNIWRSTVYDKEENKKFIKDLLSMLNKNKDEIN